MIKKTILIIFAMLCSCMFAQQQVTDSLHNTLATSKNASEKLDSYISLAKHYKHQSPIEGRRLLTLAKAIAVQLKDTIRLFKIAEIEADIYYIIGDTEKEITVIKEAVLLVEQYKNKQLEARALKLLGNAYFEIFDYDKQLENYLKAPIPKSYIISSAEIPSSPSGLPFWLIGLLGGALAYLCLWGFSMVKS